MKNPGKYVKSILCFILAVIGIILGIFIGIKFIRFFMPFFIGWVIALIANPVVRFAESKMKMVRKHTSMLIIIIVLGLIIGGGYLGIVKMSEEISRLVTQAPDIYSSFSQDFNEVEKNLNGVIKDLPEDVQTSIADVQNKIGIEIGNIVSGISEWTVNSAGAMAKHLPNVLIGIIFTILSAYFFTADRDKILDFGREHTPGFIQKKWKLLADNFKLVIGGYFKAQFKIMAIVWVILSIGFLILKIKFSVLVAFLVAFLDMLPFFGTGTALIPWALFKVLSGDVRFAIGLVILYLITQLIRRILEPKLVGDSVGIAPLWALIFMYTGYKLGGILGMILAVPIGAITINFYNMGIFDDVIEIFKSFVQKIYIWLRPGRESSEQEITVVEAQDENTKE